MGRLPIHYACFSDNPSVDIIQCLLSVYPDGAQVSARTSVRTIVRTSTYIVVCKDCFNSVLNGKNIQNKKSSE